MPEVNPLARPTIREAVAEAVSSLSDRTRAAVVEHFAAEEATKQANAIVVGLGKMTALEKERVRIKPAPLGFDGGGQPVGEPMFTKDQIDQMKKIDEQLDKLLKAINKADDKADFGDLYNLTKGS